MTSPSDIPDEAVEAAAVAWTRLMCGCYDPEDVPHLHDELRKILEAAAPHLRELQWGVRDRHSLTIAGHPSEGSARATASVHPEWYEVVSRPMPGLWAAR